MERPRIGQKKICPVCGRVALAVQTMPDGTVIAIHEDRTVLELGHGPRIRIKEHGWRCEKKSEEKQKKT